MPIFSHWKFTTKNSKPRASRLDSAPKYTEDINDFKNIKLKLSDDKEFQFIDGVWMNLKKNQHENVDDVGKLIKKNQKLEEENAMMNVKMDIMLDLLSECVSEKEAAGKK